MTDIRVHGSSAYTVSIGRGLLILAGVENGDTEQDVIEYSQPFKAPAKNESVEYVTEDGLTAREVTLGDLFDDEPAGPAQDEDEDSGFGIPPFLRK